MLDDFLQRLQRIKNRDESCTLFNAPQTLEKNIRWALLSYPSLFQTRGDVLTSLYFVVGNGYDWIEGQLIDKFFDPQRSETFLEEIHQLATEFTASFPNFRYRDILPQLLDEDKPILNIGYLGLEQLSLYLEAQREYPANSLDLTLKRESLYPVSEDYASFFKVPEDVHLDYLQGAIEAGEIYVSIDPDSRVVSQLEKLKTRLNEGQHGN